ncbi:MAG: FkbM family methyltransferase [Proteobacteria bacterium]|nr:FkbM family methyltransferase [Pseudomonadota bacterium]MBI3496328.1 FkbM family methyltransferase [Pseudomonadota bacterium]
MAPAHHPIFERFVRTPQKTDGTFVDNFVGAKTRNEYEAAMPPIPKLQTLNFSVSGRALKTDPDPSLPQMLSEDYFEWIDTLEAIDQAEGDFVMMELGAGYGRWLVNAAAAIRRHKTKSGLAAHFTAVEASPTRFRWLEQNFKDNGLDTATHRLLWGAVSDGAEPVMFPIYNANWPGNQDHDYGARLKKPDGSGFQRVNLKTDLNQLFPDLEYYESPAAEGQVFIRVPTTPLSHLLGDRSRVDLLDMDVQGAELAIIADSMDMLNRKVKRVHVGTHGEDIERAIKATFVQNRWVNVWDMPWHKMHGTSYGDMYFCDGIQGWKNPAFL